MSAPVLAFQSADSKLSFKQRKVFAQFRALPRRDQQRVTELIAFLYRTPQDKKKGDA